MYKIKIKISSLNIHGIGFFVTAMESFVLLQLVHVFEAFQYYIRWRRCPLSAVNILCYLLSPLVPANNVREVSILLTVARLMYACWVCFLFVHYSWNITHHTFANQFLLNNKLTFCLIKHIWTKYFTHIFSILSIWK